MISPYTDPAPTSALSCPFCGYTGRIAIRTEKTTTEGVFMYSALCQRCGAQGPNSLVESAAAHAWNARLEPLDSEDLENGEPFLERPTSTLKRTGDPRFWKPRA